MNTHKEPTTGDNEFLDCAVCCGAYPSHATDCPTLLEPTPPSQIEESQTQRSLREMYELGKEHGRNLALKDMEIEKLIKEIKGE